MLEFPRRVRHTVFTIVVDILPVERKDMKNTALVNNFRHVIGQRVLGTYSYSYGILVCQSTSSMRFSILACTEMLQSIIMSRVQSRAKPCDGQSRRGGG